MIPSSLFIAYVRQLSIAGIMLKFLLSYTDVNNDLGIFQADNRYNTVLNDPKLIAILYMHDAIKARVQRPLFRPPTSSTILLPHVDLSLKLLITLSLASFTTGALLRSLSRHTHAVIPVKQDLWTGEELIDLLER